jgi:uroporphyrin-III C-methyltransferase / precorrin-2 dehydrogenase / sirohydrochlorin ferrochelatase
VIVHDGLVPEAVIAMGRRDATRVNVGKRKGAHSATQDEINAILVREAGAGRRVVRLKAGDPLVFGRAGEEMAALRVAKIPFEVVPGVTAALAAAADAEIPLTFRGTASSLVFATGHDASGEVLPDWTALALAGATVAVYMGRSVAASVADRLMQAGLPGATPVAVIENATLPERRHFAGVLRDLTAFAERTDVNGPALILIGRTAAEGALSLAEPLPPARTLAA